MTRARSGGGGQGKIEISRARSGGLSPTGRRTQVLTSPIGRFRPMARPEWGFQIARPGATLRLEKLDLAPDRAAASPIGPAFFLGRFVYVFPFSRTHINMSLTFS